jgi:hypothetical protein
MPQYLVTIQLPDDFDPSTVDEAMIHDMDALGKEMIAAGVITDGPYVEAKEHVGGFSIVECADLDEALAWARKSAKVCRASGEVREIFFRPSTD